MAMLAGVGRHNDGSAIGAESGRQRFERGDFKMRMIDGQKHRGAGIRGDQSQSTLQRAEHAAIGIGINGKQNLASALNARSDSIRVKSDDNNDGIANRGEEADETV